MTLHSFRLFLIAGFFGSVLSAQGPKFPISFTAPTTWRLLEAKEQNGAEVSLYKIRENQISESLQTTSNALISRYKLPDGISFKDADMIVASHVRDAKLIVSGQDGESWKTYVYVVYEGGQQLIILYRIGILNGFVAEAMLCFPHVSSKDNKVFSVLTVTESTVKAGQMSGVYCNPASMVDMVKQFNELCSSLKISGMNTFSSRAELVDPPPQATYYRKTEETKK